MPSRTIPSRWLGVCAALLLGACTKSHDLAGPGLSDLDAAIDEGGNDAGRGGSTARAGRGGTGGRAGSAAGSGGTPSCASCPAPGLLAGLVTATSCCTSDGVCGLTAPTLGVTECQQLDGPGAQNSSCPGMVIRNLLPLEGCCTPEGECGVLDTVLGLGCALVSTGEQVRCTP